MKDDFMNGLAWCGVFALMALTGVAIDSNAKVKSEKLKTQLPPEYWASRTAEAQERIKKHQLDIESKERLKRDERDRADAARRERMAFEQKAPAEYWAYKAAQERMAADIKIASQKHKTEKEIASMRAEALENSASLIADAFDDE